MNSSKLCVRVPACENEQDMKHIYGEMAGEKPHKKQFQLEGTAFRYMMTGNVFKTKNMFLAWMCNLLCEHRDYKIIWLIV